MPRITITLTDKQYELFKALSTYTGSPMSQAIAEICEAAMPILETTCQTFKALYEQRQQHNQKLQRDLQEAQDALEPVAANVLNQFNLFMENIVATRTRNEDEERPLTPHTNRGDTPPHKPLVKTAPKPNKHKASRGVSNSKKIGGLNS